MTEQELIECDRCLRTVPGDSDSLRRPPGWLSVEVLEDLGSLVRMMEFCDQCANVLLDALTALQPKERQP